MLTRILVIDPSPLSAENLRSRLAHYGQVQIVGQISELEAVLAQSWDVAVTEWSLGSLSGGALLSRLGVLKCPLFLFTDSAEAESGVDSSAGGLKGVFNRFQRADLVLAVERVLLQASTTAAVPGSGGSILLVEDSPTMRQFVRTILKDAFPGQDVVEAEDGRGALAAMKNNRVSLVITDLQMPGMDGLSFVQLLRNNPVLKRKPVLVLSAAVSDGAKANLAQLERVQVLLKPASPQDLVAAVKALLA